MNLHNNKAGRKVRKIFSIHTNLFIIPEQRIMRAIDIIGHGLGNNATYRKYLTSRDFI
jgi:hypothetical protein